MNSRVVILRLLFAGAGVLGAVPALACSDTGVFGFDFGKPVPADAGKKQSAGGSVSNSLACFDGDVPTPVPLFQAYAYCANRDRKTVYAIEAKFQFANGQSINNAEPELVQKATEAILSVKQTWEEKFGFQYSKDFESHALSWTAYTPTLRSNIAVRGGNIVVECVNLALESKALSAAMKSWR